LFTKTRTFTGQTNTLSGNAESQDCSNEFKKNNKFVDTAAIHPVTGSSNYDKGACLLMSQAENYSVILSGDKIWKHTSVHT
jgi:hypothetical protein